MFYIARWDENYTANRALIPLTISLSFSPFILDELNREVLVEDIKAISNNRAAIVKVILVYLINSKVLSKGSTTVYFFNLSNY